jgi:hypothetical protein
MNLSVETIKCMINHKWKIYWSILVSFAFCWKFFTTILRWRSTILLYICQCLLSHGTSIVKDPWMPLLNVKCLAHGQSARTGLEITMLLLSQNYTFEDSCDRSFKWNREEAPLFYKHILLIVSFTEIWKKHYKVNQIFKLLWTL